MLAWYKPHHEPNRADVEDNSPAGYAQGLQRLNAEDLSTLRSQWYGELKLIENGDPLPSDLEVARSKLQMIRTEIARRSEASDR